MRKNKVWAILSTTALASSIILPSSIVSGQTQGYNANPSIQDVGSKLRSESLEEAKEANKIDLSGSSTETSQTSSSSNTLTQENVGIVKKWLTNNDYTAKYTLTDFTLRAVGKYGEVWVANNLSYPTNDPRNGKVAISDEQVNYLLNQFDNNMYEKETSFFGKPKERTGEDGYNGWYKDKSGRTVILIDNIKDASYYNPNYPSYIAGYFSPSISDFADRNVMTIDAYDWVNRTGPNSANPYLYEGVFAHEFQHLLHRDSDAAEENFVNEGLSDFAQYLVGYGHSTKHVEFFMNNLRNSLTIWGDQSDLQILGDYGTAYLFQLYLYERFGEPFIQAEFKNQRQGISGINESLKEIGAKEDFATLYQDYMTAVMVDGKYLGSNTFKYNLIDLKPNISAVKQDNIVPAWGTDLKTIIPDKKIDHLYFKGLDFLSTKWTSAEDPTRGKVLWSNEGDQADNFLIKELDLTNLTQAAVSFDTKYDIEEQWDFGAVQVSTDNGKTWTSLSNADTRSDLVNGGYPKIKENLPGFTGSSNGWKTETFDLSQYKGQKILLGFRYLTDWGFNEAGWYLSNLQLNGNLIDKMEDTSGFMSLEQATKEYVNYQVQFIGYKKGAANGTESHVKVIRFPSLVNMSEADRLDLKNMLRSAEFEKVVMMTTYAAPEGKNGSVDYNYDVVMKNTSKKSK
ncbi:immune inhibitor A domain-containing protein [Neobacillus cucumis]|uniref:immune inhibitor A domain-containing protein n=1 Tax=Neobacillus cucumis TaxID=1740721 RepID=UPI0015E0E048|nr:immune inhibitor A domain-containing protein [Neobacillus cucumis]